MRFTDYLALALRSLRRSRLRSGLTIAAIVIGATGVTIMLTFVTSVKSYVVKQFTQTGQIRQIQVSETPNLTYDPSGQGGGGGEGPAPAPASPNGGSSSSTPVLTPALEAKVAAIPHVTGVAATLGGGGGPGGIQYLSYGTRQLQSSFLSGYEPNGVIEPKLVAGRALEASDTANVILVTQDYADALGFKNGYARLIGQTVELHTQPGYAGVGASLPSVVPPDNCGPGRGGGGPPGPGRLCGPQASLPALVLPARVVGVVAPSFQQRAITLPLAWLVAIENQAAPDMRPQPQPGNGGGQCRPNQPCPPPSPGPQSVTWTREDPAKFVADRGGYQSLIAAVDTVDDVGPVATEIGHFGVSTATGLAALNEAKKKANVVGVILGSLGFIALAIAALGVMNTMVMSILERTREIGVMRALGARRSTIRRLFAFEAAALGFFGGLFGVIIGYVFVLVAKPVISHAVKSGKIGGANFQVPIWLVVVVIAGTTLIGVLSGLLPARRAARLDPVEALRYE